MEMGDSGGKKKEYYQVNLDMGRIFWIVFLIGIIIIAIFVLGFYIGGGTLKERLLSAGKTLKDKESVTETVHNQAQKEGKIPLSELFGKGNTPEIQYIDKESIKKAVRNAVTENKEENQTLPTGTQSSSTIRRTPSITTRSTGIRNRSSGRISKGEFAYYIQVASFSRRENAKRLADRLRANLYKVHIEEKQIGDITFYRVQVGPFGSKRVASNTLIAMKHRYKLPDPFVIEKKSS